MSHRYLVTTLIGDLPSGPIAMVDGTVPGWVAGSADLHFDHHRPGGAEVQIAEIPESACLPTDVTFVTTLLDADASAAVAWLRLLQLDLPPAVLEQARIRLTAIAYDCDHLGLPEGVEHDPWRTFAAHAVAAMKEVGRNVHERIGLPERKHWTEAQRTEALSHSFRENVDWFVEAALNHRPWPGECGEANAYFHRQAALQPLVDARCWLYRGCMVFDQRGLTEYVDARLPVEWARRAKAPRTFTLTIRDGSGLPEATTLNWPDHLPRYSYTLGRIPLHADGSPKYSDCGVWEALSASEAATRVSLGISGPAAHWGGRNDVGGSSFRHPVVMRPEQVLDQVIELAAA
jgi:hypothetical protein